MRSVLLANLVLLGLVGGGGCVLYHGIDQLLDIHDRETWPTTDGTVLNAHVNRHKGVMLIEVRYQYRIDGERYEGANEVRHSPSVGHLPSTYATGRTIAVLYDPEQPERSALDVGNYVLAIYKIIGGVIALLILSPFVVFFGALLYAKIMMIKARYHLRMGMAALEEAVEESNAIARERGEMPEVLADRGLKVIAMAERTRSLIEEMEQEMSGYESPVDESETLPASNPLPFLGTATFWRITLVVLATYGGAWVIALTLASGMRGYLNLIAVAAGLVSPMATGIWFGLRLVERSRQRVANLLGGLLLASGAVMFALVASRSRVGYWETIEGGDIIGPIGTYLGLGTLLFGLGMLQRHLQKLKRG